MDWFIQYPNNVYAIAFLAVLVLLVFTPADIKAANKPRNLLEWLVFAMKIVIFTITFGMLFILMTSWFKR